MPRGKKKENTIPAKDVKNTLLTCKQFTQDQVRTAVAEICNREDIDTQKAQRIANVLDTVLAASFSKIMANSGM